MVSFAVKALVALQVTVSSLVAAQPNFSYPSQLSELGDHHRRLGFAEDSCDQGDHVPEDNSDSPTTRVRCCGGVYGAKNARDTDKKWASCDTSSCPNNFNHMKNLNCHNYGSPQHPLEIRDGESKGGSNICPYYKKDQAICDVSYYVEQNEGLNCRTNENGKNFQVHCLGKVRCGSAGVFVPKKGKSDGTDRLGDTDFGECESGAEAGVDCFYNGASENFKVCAGDADDAEVDEDTDAEKWEKFECHQKYKACENGYLCKGNQCYIDDSPEPAQPAPVPVPAPQIVPQPESQPNPPAPDTPSAEDKVTPKAFTKGDPHFKTFGGELYDYHGECDLVLLHNPDFKQGLGMDIHIRTKIEAFWSSVESAVIKVGDDTMEIKADPESDEWLWFNGEVPANDVVEGEWHRHELAGFLVRYQASGPNTREVNLYLKGSKEVIMMKTFKTFVRVDIDWEGSVNYENSVGLLGSQAHEGKRLGREGKFIEDANAFGQEWQVQPEVDGSLFHSYEGAVVGKQCVLPPHFEGDSLTAASLRGRRLGASALDTAAAEKACNHLVDPEEIKACVFDVVATQDLSMASTW